MTATLVGDATPYDCLILGAGASGLMAATTLHEAGYRIAVVEARDRIGGRAYSGPLSDGSIIEYGAQQIHGPTVATWELVARWRLTTHLIQAPERNADAVFHDGAWEEGDPVSEEAYGRLKETLKDYPTRPGADETSLHDALVDAGLKGPVLTAAEGRFNVLHGIDPRRVSARSAAYALRFAGTGLPNFTLVEGHSRLWELMSEPYRDVIHLRSPIRTVVWSDDGVEVRTDRGGFAGKTAIVTFPVGVLQSGAPRFEPGLPSFKLDAISGLGMGPIIVVFAEFATAWWEGRLGTVSGFRRPGSIFHSWDALFWDRPGPAVLRAFIGRRGADRSGHPDAIRSTFLAELHEMFPGVDIESELVDLRIEDWVADPWSRGGVSVGPIGNDGLRRGLMKPTPPLFWAGEATHIGGNAVATHGALEAGRRAATEAMHLLRPLRVTSPPSPPP